MWQKFIKKNYIIFYYVFNFSHNDDINNNKNLNVMNDKSNFY